MMPWLFDKFQFSLVPFKKDKESKAYYFTYVPYWISMERQVAMDVGGLVEDVIAID